MALQRHVLQGLHAAWVGLGDAPNVQFDGRAPSRSAEPVYGTLPGRESSTRDARKVEDLPAKARADLDRIEEFTSAPAEWVSVGTHRGQIIEVE